MDDKTKKILTEIGIPALQIEELVKAAQEAIAAATSMIADIFTSIVGTISDLMPAIIEEIEKAIAENTDNSRRQWKPVKNMIPRYQIVTRKVIPRARSCC